MAMTIGSVVNRASMPKLLRAHALGLALGAVTMALGLSLLGALVKPALRELAAPLTIVGSVVLLGWAAHAMGWRGLPFPQRSWQVPEQWRYRLPPTITLGAYGYLLGLGWLTYLVLPTYWLLVAGTLAMASLPVALLAWTGFAVGRFLPARRYARRFAGGSDNDIKPHNLRLTRTSAAALLCLAALALAAQVV
jgi:cytochrome c biogenesis protein CcdA